MHKSIYIIYNSNHRLHTINSNHCTSHVSRYSHTHTFTYKQHTNIQQLAIITSINFVLAASAILMLPHGQPVLSLFDGRLTRAQQLYNFTDKYLTLNESALQTTSTTPAATSLPSITLLSPEQNDASELKQRTVRQSASLQLNQLSNNSNSTDKLEKLSPSEATKIWDQLQARGPCCGLHNATIEWQPDRIPKSCCSQPVEDSKGQMVCKSIDNEHNKPCACVIESASMNVLFLLALIAFASLYLATVSGVSTYRTFHYNEASQNAYG